MRIIGLLVIALFLVTSANGQDEAVAKQKAWGLQGSTSTTDLSRQCTGLMVMAHGGSPEWDASIYGLVSGLRAKRPVAVSLGMANPSTMKEAVDSLMASSVHDILVVRVFMSSTSFLGATRYVLGLQDQEPRYSMYADEMTQLNIPVPIRIGGEGLLEAPEVGGILRTRALALSAEPSKESVLILAHGAGADEENDVWLSRMDAQADSIRTAGGFVNVRAETLREDWDDKREAAEARIRDFVADEQSAGRTVIVIPLRVSGFGPYAQVLEGLEYRSDGLGLLPDARIADWVRRQLNDHQAANACG